MCDSESYGNAPLFSYCCKPSDTTMSNDEGRITFSNVMTYNTDEMN